MAAPPDEQTPGNAEAPDDVLGDASAGGTLASGTPASGTPASGTPASGTPASGTPRVLRTASVRLNRAGEVRVRRGHPWIFEDMIARAPATAAAGDVATLYDTRNRLVAVGLFDPSSPIRVRVWAGPGERIDEALFVERLTASVARRASVASARTTGYRVVNGPNDAMPGVVLDRYDRTLVLKLYAASLLPHLPSLVRAIEQVLAPDVLVLRLSRAVAAHELAAQLADGVTILGALDDGPVAFLENGVVFEADPLRGQKTGFFLDQRDNRALLERRTPQGARVLNVFAYSGGFSLYAARAGASHVTSLDLSPHALAQAERHMALNAQRDARVAAAEHRSLCGDAFAELQRLRDAGESFDVVVIDPPSFAKRAAERERALVSYGRLARLGAALVRPGGLLVLASCSSRVDAASFRSASEQGVSAAGRRFEVVDVTGHAPDHPATIEEAEYLKAVWMRLR